MRVTRRSGLPLAAPAAVAMFVSACPALLSQILFSPDAPPGKPAPLPDNPFRSGSKSLVAVVHGEDVSRMVERAVYLIGGMSRLGGTGGRPLVQTHLGWGG